MSDLDDLLNELEGAMADAPAPAAAPRATGTTSTYGAPAPARKPAASGGRAAARFAALRGDSDSAAGSSSARAGPAAYGHGAPRARGGAAEGKKGGDDLDELLNMVGSSPPKRAPSSRSASGAGASGAGASTGSSGYTAPARVSDNSGLATSHGTKRCGIVYLGGAASVMGRSRPGVRRGRPPVCCDNLRCTHCDFAVLRLAKRKWDSAADYMWFRNYMPDAAKLTEQAVPNAECNAYCCQCTWHSIAEGTKLSALDTHWVCSGHAQ